MTALEKKAHVGLFRFLICVAAVMFLTAWTLDYWQAWLFLAVFFGSSFAIISYLAKYDPKLLERRMTAALAPRRREARRSSNCSR
jgi:hypothetical protein